MNNEWNTVKNVKDIFKENRVQINYEREYLTKRGRNKKIWCNYEFISNELIEFHNMFFDLFYIEN